MILPTINDNVDDPNMIIYFNGDEGGLMDVAWNYYIGEKRNSFQWDFDYGLEMVYLADFARLVLSKFIDFTPGTFVLILRWVHLLAWILSLLALWWLISYHFGKGWQPIMGVTLLAVRPAFAYFAVNLKPDPLALLFMIIGLDYSLRIVEKPTYRNLLIAGACAAIAFTIKYVGLFLLVAIVAAMYLSELYQRRTAGQKNFFPRLKIFWILPALCGFALVALTLIIVFFYVRKSTGTSWYEEYGIWGSLLRNKAGLYSFFAGIFFVFLSVIIWILNRNSNSFLKRAMDWLKAISSYALIVLGIFIGFVVLFGVRWIVSPQYFILAYAFLGSTAPAGSVSLLAEKGFLYAFFQKLGERIMEFDPILLFLLFFYLGVEIYYRRKNFKEEPVRMLKRLVLLVFLLPFVVLLGAMLRIGQHHMLPFSAAMSILIVQGIEIFKRGFNGKKLFKNCVLIFIGAFLLIDVFMNGSIIVKDRIRHFNREKDVVFEIKKWWKQNIPLDATIVAEHYSSVYIPEGYKNIKTIPWGNTNRIEQLRRLVDIYHPRYIYYNENPYEETPLRPIEKILPGKKTRLIKSFETTGRCYQRNSGDKFVIYEVLY